MARGYNKMQYNTNRYNADGNELIFADSLGITDTDIVHIISFTLVDLVFFDDSPSLSITNHVFNETLRLSDWLSIERNPTDSEWYT